MNGSANQASLTSLFVGNLDTRVYRELLTEIFSLAGDVTQCHVVYDKNTGVSSGFGFVQYDDHSTAEAAMDKFRGRSIYGKLLTIDWARASSRDTATGKADDPASHFCLFVGNLSPDVTDEQLVTAFSEFGSCSSAKCAKDPVTHKTQGFAFVSFRERPHAVAAMEAMNGQLLNNRPLRVDWAKGKTGANKTDDPAAPEPKKESLSFEAVLAQTTLNNVTAYISGLPASTNEDGIREIFSRHGPIREVRIPESAKTQSSETIYAFVRYMDHTSAAKAIFECQGGTLVETKTVNVHWGRETVRRPPPVMQRPPVAHPNYYHAGFQQPPNQFPPQSQYPPQAQYSQPHYPPSFPYAAQPPAQRSAYPNQPYARGPPPGPIHQPHATHRYRPY